MDAYGCTGINPINIDSNRLAQLGFTQNDIQNLMYVYNNGGKFTPMALQQYGFNYEQAKKIGYMYGICSGRVSINSKEEMIKHLRKMFGSNYRIGIQDLAVSKIKDVPQVAVVANIMQPPYDIYNSKNYKGIDAMYKVVESTPSKITIETPRKPRLQYGQSKELPGVLKIDGVRANGNAVVTFDSKYCKLCNRFIIVASLKQPEFHHGCYECMCFEGTRVFVYCTDMGVKNKARYSMASQRIYDYGIFPKDIKSKLDKVTKQMYNYLHCVSAEFQGSNAEYFIVPPDKPDDTEDEVEIID